MNCNGFDIKMTSLKFNLFIRRTEVWNSKNNQGWLFCLKPKIY